MPAARPSREEFDRLAAEYSVVPVWREVVADLETPVSAFLKISAAPPGAHRHCFLLESVEGGERWGRYSFIGLDPFLVMTSAGGVVSWEGSPPPAAAEAAAGGATPLEVLRAVLASFATPDLAGLPPLHAGAVGYLGYDVVRYLERLPQTTADDVGVPELMLMFPRSLFVFDHLRQRVSIVANVVADDSYDEALARIDELASRLGRALSYRPLELEPIEVTLPPSTLTREAFEAAVEVAREYIFAGDIFQVVLSQRFSSPFEADPFDVYRVLRLVNPSPYMFYLRHPEITVIGSSPEPLIKVEGRHVTQRPIAGSRPRGADEEEDAALAAELVSDEKERAEHIMLVDLARNDVGRVSEWGSVAVDELMVVERYSHIMHLVSQVSGQLREGSTALDALYASFPAGTVSGAPKIRAMEIVDQLEPTRRGPYAGVVGYFDFSGNLDTCIALRTAYIAGGRFHIQAGGGIVADSDPSKEWWESVNKAKALLTAAQLAERLHR
ncbi:MAG TPA: anthranilate synthase component I [Actinomycetota bacterium]|nr:anthranilate synthase component I [Actinomycetota bacterium]